MTQTKFKGYVKTFLYYFGLVELLFTLYCDLLGLGTGLAGFIVVVLTGCPITYYLDKTE